MCKREKENEIQYKKRQRQKTIESETERYTPTHPQREKD